MNQAHVLHSALSLPHGARFHRVALQVNPYAYLLRHGTLTDIPDEATYNASLVAALTAEGVSCIAVTDHYRVKHSATLMEAAREAGITVFPGFEANTKDGVHLLCLFDPGTTLDIIQAKIHSCGVHDDTMPSPLGDLSTAELLSKCSEWRMQCIAPHAMSASGILTCLKGQARMALWKHECLAACGIPGPLNDTPQQFSNIIHNTNADYRRSHRVAVLNVGDVNGPADAARPGTSSLVKMNTPTLEGLRQAFLDPDSRVRLLSDPRPEEHAEFLGMSWETAGFLQGLRLRFNENLNVIIGGRGTGKSTVIESLRYVLGLQPIGTEALAAHENTMRSVLGGGTKVSVLVQTFRPDKRRYIVERTFGNPPVVRDEATGNVLASKPSDIIPKLTILGQNEVAELARQPSYLTELLMRFTDADDGSDAERRRLSAGMERSRRELSDLAEEQHRIDDELAALPGIEETLERYRTAGVEERLGHRSLIVREEGIIASVRGKLDTVANACSELETMQPLRLDELSETGTAGLPTKAGLDSLRAAMASFNAAMDFTIGGLKEALARARGSLGEADAAVALTRLAAEDDYQRLLRELRTTSHIDGAEFMALRGTVERLRPLQERRAGLVERMDAARQRRRNDLTEWEELKRKALERLQATALRLNQRLSGQLRVKVVAAGDRSPVLDVIKGVGGRVSEAVAALSAVPDLSVATLAQAVREGDRALARLGIPAAQAQRIADGGEELAMRIEELELPPSTGIQLNVSRDGEPPEWRGLTELSVGQKATAILYLLLIESDAPLVIDQPEDNLDNRFISDGIVPRVKAEKLRRQFIFASHNANLPVLGDAEQIVVLQTGNGAGGLQVVASPELMGAIDLPSVRSAVEEILEGGKDAFTIRRRKYGF